MIESADTPERRILPRAFAAADPDRVDALAQQLATTYAAQAVVETRVGAMRLCIQDGVDGGAISLGDVPAAIAIVRLTAEPDACVEGGAVIMGDDAARAFRFAVLDGVLASRLPGWEQVARLAWEGVRRLSETERVHHAMTERTRVAFSRLDGAAST